jgi:hypothetical protein
MSAKTRMLLIAFVLTGLTGIGVILVVAAKSRQAGPGKGKEPDKGKEESAVAATLTKGQRAAWDRARAQAKPGNLFVFALTGVDKPEWGCVVWDSKKSEPFGTFGQKGTVYSIDKSSKPDIGHPKESAILYSNSARGYRSGNYEEAVDFAIHLPGVQCAAVVDLFSKPDPVIISWNAFDGRKASTSKQAPNSAAERSFLDYLHAIQANMGN